MKIGVLGGGNLLAALNIPYECVAVETAYGAPSDVLRIGHFNGIEIVTLLRHGGGHSVAAHKVNYRANVDALASVGVDILFGVSVAGDLAGVNPEGAIVLYDQILDFTNGRAATFFDDPPVRHLSASFPVCTTRTRWAAEQLSAIGLEPVHGGVMAVIQGPRFATAAESKMLRMVGGDYVNMSAAPEAFLARELGLCYIPLALITDDDNVATEGVTLNSITTAILRQRDRMPRAIGGLMRAVAESGLPQCNRCKPPSPIDTSHLQL